MDAQIGLTIITILLALIALSGCTDQEAMDKCQEKHSYDTCFYALHR